MSALVTTSSASNQGDYNLQSTESEERKLVNDASSSLEQEILIGIKQRRSSSVYGNIVSLEQINREAEQEAAEIINGNGSFDQKNCNITRYL